jgi:hypothetical protein
VPNFVAFFPSREAAQPPTAFSALERIFRAPLRADDVRTDVLRGATLLRTRSAGMSPRFRASEDGAGWIVVKGQIFDVRSETPLVELEELLQRFLAEDLADLNRYEGTFALAAWDARRRQGWALNDQASMLNLYYGEQDAGLYVATNAFSLACALGLGLNPHGVQELLARNALLAPTTMFAGLRRVNVGEHIRYRAGTLAHGEHWNKYEPEADYRSVREAADAAAGVVGDRVARYAAVAGGPVVCDLTGGLDSRLIASTADAAGLKPAVTVNGPPDREDVRIAHQVASAMQWGMKYFNTPLLWRVEITPDMRRELLYRTNGELPFSEAYHHLLSRPQLASQFDLHLMGNGGELLRYFPWSQEFFGIGRRRLASVNRLLDYRFLGGAPPPSLFSQNWLPALRSRLGARIEAICGEQPGTRTTQQLDAVYVWKMTGHSSVYISAVYDWLPSVAPLLSAGLVKASVSMPWKMRLTSQLQRQMIYATSARAAGIATVYGATAEPTSFKNVHLAAWQSAKRAAHLFEKLDSVLLRGTLTERSPSKRAALEEHKSFLMHQAERLLTPKSMLSRALYTTEGLHKTLSGSDEDRQARYSVIMRLATVEALCRELGFEPEEDFLSTAPMEQAEDLSVEELQLVRDYEELNKKRQTLPEQMDREIRATS